MKDFLADRPGVKYKNIQRTAPTLTIACHCPGGFDAPAADTTLAALVCDEWPEFIPDPFQTAGIGFHYDAPGARPPQSHSAGTAAASSIRTRGRSTDLLDVIHEAFDLAKLRAVRPQDLKGGLGALLPGNYLPQTYTDHLPSVQLLKMQRDAMDRLVRDERQTWTPTCFTLGQGLEDRDGTLISTKPKALQHERLGHEDAVDHRRDASRNAADVGRHADRSQGAARGSALAAVAPVAVQRIQGEDAGTPLRSRSTSAARRWTRFAPDRTLKIVRGSRLAPGTGAARGLASRRSRCGGRIPASAARRDFTRCGWPLPPLRTALLRAYPLTLDPPVGLEANADQAGLLWSALFNQRTIDASALAEDLLPLLAADGNARRRFHAAIVLGGGDAGPARDVLGRWMAWFRTLAYEGDEADRSWQRNRMEYAFALKAGDIALKADEYHRRPRRLGRSFVSARSN